MNRRNFLQRLVWAAAATVVVPKAGPKTIGNDCVFVSFTPARLEDCDDNWWAFRELVYQIHRDGHEARTFSLEAEADGYRRVRMEVMSMWTGKKEVWTWDQPWSREAHYKQNLHLDFGPCSDCGASTKTPHTQECKHSTALAHKLGPDLKGFKIETDLITAPTKDYEGPWKS